MSVEENKRDSMFSNFNEDDMTERSPLRGSSRKQGFVGRVKESV